MGVFGWISVVGLGLWGYITCWMLGCWGSKPVEWGWADNLFDSPVGLRHDRVGSDPLDRPEEHQMLLVPGSGFRVQGSGFRGQGSGFRVRGWGDLGRQVVPEDVKLPRSAESVGWIGRRLTG